MNFKKPKFWDLSKPNFLSYLFFPLTFFIRINNYLLNQANPRKNKLIKTICIGNIYLGGTGKTPTVIKVYDIAKRLIRLSGNIIQSKHNKKGDIPIKIIGLKKGEKMNEEISLGSNLLRTSHSKIMHCKEKINIKNFTLRLNTFINKFYN